MRSIEPFINRKMVVLHEQATVLQAARAMCENKIGCIIIDDQQGHIVGMITDRDLCCYVLAPHLPAETEITEVMALSPVTAAPTATIDDVIELMIDNGIRRIPIVVQKNVKRQRCVGIVTLDDLIAAQSISMLQLAKVVKTQMARRRKVPCQSSTSPTNTHETRSESHMMQTLHRFYKTIASRIDVDEAVAAEVTWIVLSNLVQRLHYTGAVHFISQLPHKLQETLLDLPAGPDRTINAESIVCNLMEFLGRSENDTKLVISQFYKALEELGNQKELNHVRMQLPEEMQSLFRAA